MAKNHPTRYRLVRLEREELIDRCKLGDYEVWGAPALTRDQYLREEKAQRDTTRSSRRLIVWALVERTPERDSGAFGTHSDMDDTGIDPARDPIVCHCESYAFDCLLRKLGGEIISGNSYHINAVYTLPRYRNQGHAKFFLKEVSRQLSRLENAVASALFSDIGTVFYERLG